MKLAGEPLEPGPFLSVSDDEEVDARRVDQRPHQRVDALHRMQAADEDAVATVRIEAELGTRLGANVGVRW